MAPRWWPRLGRGSPRRARPRGGAGRHRFGAPTATRLREATGYAIGGVPPFGHADRMQVIVDRDLTAFPVVHAAAGLPDATFAIAPDDLVRVSGGRVADIAERPAAGPDA